MSNSFPRVSVLLQRATTSQATRSRMCRSWQDQAMKLPTAQQIRKLCSDKSMLPPHRFKHVDNPGLRIEHFQQLFHPSGSPKAHKYPRRWDWHLRMFIYSLIPPCMLFLFTVAVDKYVESDEELQRLIKHINIDPAFMSSPEESTQGDVVVEQEKNDLQKASLMALLEQRIARMEAAFESIVKKIEKLDEGTAVDSRPVDVGKREGQRVKGRLDRQEEVVEPARLLAKSMMRSRAPET